MFTTNTVPVLSRDEFSVLVQGHFDPVSNTAIIDYLSVDIRSD